MSSDLITAPAEVSLANFTSPGLIIPHLCGRDAAAAIRELAAALQREACVPDLLPFYHAAINREFLFSTAMGHGFAYPHARVSGLMCLYFALGRSAEPLAWVPKGSPSVRLVFLFAVPATDAAAYLLLISRLARLTRETFLVEKLLKAGDTPEILDLLNQIKLRADQPVVT